jgi:hypothetical protein
MGRFEDIHRRHLHSNVRIDELGVRIDRMVDEMREEYPDLNDHEILVALNEHVNRRARNLHLKQLGVGRPQND